MNTQHELETVLDVFDHVSRMGKDVQQLHPDYVLEKTVALMRGPTEFWCVLDIHRKERFCKLIEWRHHAMQGNAKEKPYQSVPITELVRFYDHFKERRDSEATTAKMRRLLAFYFGTR